MSNSNGTPQRDDFPTQEEFTDFAGQTRTFTLELAEAVCGYSVSAFEVAGPASIAGTFSTAGYSRWSSRSMTRCSVAPGYRARTSATACRPAGLAGWDADVSCQYHGRSSCVVPRKAKLLATINSKSGCSRL